ncbi:hypothetical protein AAIR98_000553 [Elusimicrobium simillimum]|uniref:hypothetical protein n=1 Tax=Elusimicrobium simillimum TaxID=3143438 RepID=UPI003C6FBE83
MDNKDIVETEVIEVEVLDEHGRPLNEPPKSTPPPVARGLATVLKAIAILVGGFLLSLIIAIVFIMLFLPILILKALGIVSSDFQIRRFK